MRLSIDDPLGTDSTGRLDLMLISDIMGRPADVSLYRPPFPTASFAGDVFAAVLAADGASGEQPRLSIAQLRAVLRALILLELTERGSADPRGLEQVSLSPNRCRVPEPDLSGA